MQSYTYTTKYNPDGSIEHHDNLGRLHFDDGCTKPAHVTANGDQHYYLHGVSHRPYDQPSSIMENGDTLFYEKNGVTQRTSGPAYIRGIGRKNMELAKQHDIWHLEWSWNGSIHRDENEGPASVKVDWIKNTVVLVWYNLGKIDRTNGPAYVRYAIDAFPEELLAKIVQENDLTNECIAELEGDGHIGAMEVCWIQMDMYHRPEDAGPAVIYGNGSKIWYDMNECHRTSTKGPAIIRENGYIAYVENGEFHRVDGPAVITENNGEYYYQKGYLHRENGPCVNTLTRKEWREHGEFVVRPDNEPNCISYTHGLSSKKQLEWCKTLKSSNPDDAILLDDIDDLDNESVFHEGVYHVNHRENGPAILFPDGSEHYMVNGNFHRTNGPAVVSKDGTQEYYFNGLLHNPMGPAIIEADAEIEDNDNYYLYGQKIMPFYEQYIDAENEAWHGMIGTKRMREAHMQTVLEKTRKLRRAKRAKSEDIDDSSTSE